MSVLAGVGLTALGFALTFALDPWADDSVNDLFVYRTFAEAFLDGRLPYRDVPFEYPPLALLPLLGGAAAGVGEDAYEVSFALLMLAAAGVALAATVAVADLTGGDRRRALLAFAALPLFAGAMLRTHFDLLPVAIAVAALAALLAGRVRAGFALIAAGAMTKAFPLLLAPVALAWLAGRGETAAARRGALTLGATLLGVLCAWLALSPHGALEAIEYHLERPVQVESTQALVLHAAGDPRDVSSHRSDGLADPASDAVEALFSGGLLALLAWVVLSVSRRPEPRALALGSLTGILALAALGKVLSPQFLLWVAPLGALAFAWRMHLLAAALAAATLLTLAEFPPRYFDVVAREPDALALVAARDLVLLGALGLACAELSRLPRREGAARFSSLGRPRRPRPAPR